MTSPLTKDTVPQELIVHSASKALEVSFSDGERFRLPFELLRVYSPSAEVQGHGPGQETLQTGKRHVDIVELEPVGHYGVRPVFSDGHGTGIFTWEYLHHLGMHQGPLWQQYLEKLDAVGLSRDAPTVAKPENRNCSGH